MKKCLLCICLVAVYSLSYGQKKPTVASDSAQIRTTVTAFYKWYTVNWKKLTAFKLYKGKTVKDTPPYVIDWAEAERYFSYIRKNVPYLGEGFIEKERQAFKNSEKDFKKFPEEELPSGFDYDHFTSGQEEPKYFLQEMLKKGNRWSISILPEGKAHVLVLYKEGDVFSCSDLVKEKGKWKIVNLACEQNIGGELEKETSQ